MWFIPVFLVFIGPGKGIVLGEPVIGTPYVVPLKISAVNGSGHVFRDKYYRNSIFVSENEALTSLEVDEDFANVIRYVITFYFNYLDPKLRPYSIESPNITSGVYGIAWITLPDDAPKIDILKTIGLPTRYDYDRIELHSYHIDESGTLNFRFGNSRPLITAGPYINAASVGLPETGDLFMLADDFLITREDVGAALIGIEQNRIELIGLLVYVPDLDRYSEHVRAYFWIQHVFTLPKPIGETSNIKRDLKVVATNLVKTAMHVLDGLENGLIG